MLGGNILKKAKLSYHLKEDKDDFINEMYYTTLTRARLYVYILFIIYGSLVISYTPKFINDSFNLGERISVYSYIMTLIASIMFYFVSKIKPPKTKNNITIYHKSLVNTAIFLAFLTITISSVGDDIRANSIAPYIGSLFVIATLTVMTNLVSIFVYSFNMILLFYFVNLSPLLNLSSEMQLNQNISIVIFTTTAWMFSRYFMYTKIKEYLKRKERDI